MSETVTREQLRGLVEKMRFGFAQEPSSERIAILVESILRNRLSAAEAHRATTTAIDTMKFFPTPAEFLALARPPASTAVVQSEGNRLFDLIRDNPGQAYGKYSPEVGVIRERRLIERAHGPAAGLAFVAAGGSRVFGAMTEKSEPFIRKAFNAAFESARSDHGAPLTLDPARVLESKPSRLLSGDAPAQEGGEQLRKFRDMVRGFREPERRSVDVSARVEELRRQAAEMGAAAVAS